MKYRSTRGRAEPVGFSAALEHGLAPDGGLYVPESIPALDPGILRGVDSLADAAARVLKPFLSDDVLADALPEICRDAFSFPAPLVELPDGAFPGPTAVLELWHGPTCAFKDVGARFLAACLSRLEARAGGDDRPRTVLVATSGDTGGAVAAALHRSRGAEVVVLYPQDGVSPRQEHQLTAWGDNVLSLRVRGVFDDCQQLLKSAFADPELAAARRLTTANSINIARLLPQAVYYALAGVQYEGSRGTVPGFIIPSGNAGNATAALWAREMGFPVGQVIMATNANRAIPDSLNVGFSVPRSSTPTLATAMDVGNPSNLERVFDLYSDPGEIVRRIWARTVYDPVIRSTIVREAQEDRIWDPHTAIAIEVRRGEEGDWVVVSTAHPAKFDTVVEPLVGRSIAVPPDLQQILDRPRMFRTIDPELDQLRRELLDVRGTGDPTS